MDENLKNGYIKVLNEKYKKGEKPTLEECCNGLQFYIEKLAKKYLRNENWDLHDDFIQQGYLAICQHYDEYEPQLGAPTTFFVNHIKHELQDFADNSVHKLTGHYSKRNRQINKAIETLREYGIENPTDRQIQIELRKKNPNIRIYSIQVARKVCAASKELSYDAPDFVENYGGDFSLTANSPEAIFLNKTMKNILRRAIKTLPDLQQEILQRMFFPEKSNQKTTIRAVSKGLGLSQDKVKKEYNKALKTLSKDQNLKIFGKEEAMNSQKKSQQRGSDIGIISPKAAASVLDTLDEMFQNEDFVSVDKKKEKKNKNKYNDFSD